MVSTFQSFAHKKRQFDRDEQQSRRLAHSRGGHRAAAGSGTEVGTPDVEVVLRVDRAESFAPGDVIRRLDITVVVKVAWKIIEISI